MSIKQRVQRIEQRAGMGDRPEVLLFHTIYEQQDGSHKDGPCFAMLQNGKTFLETVSSELGETFEDFKVRVRNRCFELTGKYPEEDENNGQ